MELSDYIALYEKPVEDLIELAYNTTRKNFGREVEFCSIISAKTGACSEDCKYCSQSAHNHAKVEVQPMLSVQEVVNAAILAKENGAKRFGIVTSGKKISKDDFEKVLEMVKEICKIGGIKPCCCLGIIDKSQMTALKAAGCERYNHNINTSEDYYKEICTTHTFEERIKTIKLADECGLENCTGVIIGMGESREERIKMAYKIKELDAKSVPINFLDPIEGTPLEKFGDKIDKDEIMKTICIFRLILPNVVLRYAGGRVSRLPLNYQKLGIMAGINGIITGGYLTTEGAGAAEDLKMIEAVGMKRL